MEYFSISIGPWPFQCHYQNGTGHWVQARFRSLGRPGDGWLALTAANGTNLPLPVAFARDLQDGGKG